MSDQRSPGPWRWGDPWVSEDLLRDKDGRAVCVVKGGSPEDRELIVSASQMADQLVALRAELETAKAENERWRRHEEYMALHSLAYELCEECFERNPPSNPDERDLRIRIGEVAALRAETDRLRAALSRLDTPEAVECLARAIFVVDQQQRHEDLTQEWIDPWPDSAWDEAGEWRRDEYRNQARAARDVIREVLRK